MAASVLINDIEMTPVIFVDKTGKPVVNAEGEYGLPRGDDIGLVGTLQTKSQVINDGTRKRKVFDPPIKSMSIKVRHADNTAISADQGILLTVDATDTAIADDNLDETKTGVRVNIMPDDKFQEIIFSGSTVTNIDIKGVGTNPNLVVTLGGIY